ncbi:Alkaline phosphatase [hydrothermal vent metagenome]|uniref:Altered inheritance of mitochondria protein 6 n=1 Tax=hydrothermal vent metagenome TaxID=652676 RepID=A0A3B1DJ96_9ZZZZ
MRLGKFLFVCSSIILLLTISCSPTKRNSLPATLAKAHAHNDYQHPHPLFDALSLGYVSVEADIHLVNGTLYVAHDKENITKERTLQALYLNPLRNIIKENGGYVYGQDVPFILLIDIKTDADSTYLALTAVLKKYSSMITFYDNGKRKKGAVTIIVSGNRNLELMKNENLRYAAYDGRFNDLDSNISSTLVPLISANWRNYFNWKGKGEIPAEEKGKLQRLINEAHKQGKQVRFWATDVSSTQQLNLWNTLLESDVDFIGTDKLEKLKDFLSKYD